MLSNKSPFRVLPDGNVVNIDKLIKTYVNTDNTGFGFECLAYFDGYDYAVKITKTYKTEKEAQDAVIKFIGGVIDQEKEFINKSDYILLVGIKRNYTAFDVKEFQPQFDNCFTITGNYNEAIERAKEVFDNEKRGMKNE